MIRSRVTWRVTQARLDRCIWRFYVMSNKIFFTKLRTIRSRSVLRSQTRVAFLSNIDGVSFCLHVKETSLHIPRHTACIKCSWSNIYMGHALINFKDTIYYNEDSLLVTVTSKITVNHLNRIFFYRFSFWIVVVGSNVTAKSRIGRKSDEDYRWYEIRMFKFSNLIRLSKTILVD